MSDAMQKVLLGLGIVIVAGLLWVGLVSPARDDRTAAQGAQAAAEARAAAVAGQLATSREAAERAPANARTLKRLAVAVPEKVEAPALIDQLDSTAKRHDVSFDVLQVTDGAASAAPVAPAAGTAGAAGTTTGAAGATTATTATTPATAGTPAGVAADGSAVPGAPGTAAAPAGSLPVQLSVELAGRYVDVTAFVRAVQADVRTSGGKRLRADGRLLRITSIDLASSGQGDTRNLKGTLAITAYLLPKDAAAAATTATPATPATTTASQP